MGLADAGRAVRPFCTATRAVPGDLVLAGLHQKRYHFDITTENIPDARVTKTIGQVFGLTVRSRSLGGNIAAALKSLVGGEIGSYVKLNEDARRQALDRMVQNAAAMGANAVTMMRFDSTEMGRSMTEIVPRRPEERRT